MALERQIQEILDKAKEALLNRKSYFDPNSERIVEEFMRLNIGDSMEIWELLEVLLAEIEPRHFISSAENEFTFVFNSKKMGKNMTLIFALKNDCFVYRSLRVYKGSP